MYLKRKLYNTESLKKFFMEEKNMGVNYPNYYQQTQYVNPYQVRPTYMEQQQQYQFSGLKGRPVASFDEAKASMIDFDGSIFYFPDAANKRIYTKQINIDGTSTINVYALVEAPAETPVQGSPQLELPSNLVFKEEFDNVIKALTQEIENLKKVAESQPKESPKQATAPLNMKF